MKFSKVLLLTLVVAIVLHSTVSAVVEAEGDCDDESCKRKRCKRIRAYIDSESGKTWAKCTDCGAYASLGKKELPQNDNSDGPEVCTTIPIWAIVVIVVGGVLLVGLIIWLIVRACRKKNHTNTHTHTEHVVAVPVVVKA